MTCQYCTDPDDVPCFPQYGCAPHIHTNKGMVFTGEAVEGFTPDQDEPGMGTWWCPYCKEGKPECMRTDIAALVFCDAIQLLRGWHNSKGATLEHHIAERLGLQIFMPPVVKDSLTVDQQTDWAAA